MTEGCNPPVNDRFCPERSVTRGEMAALMVRSMGYVDDGGGNRFVDDDESVFESAIDKLAAAGSPRDATLRSTIASAPATRSPTDTWPPS